MVAHSGAASPAQRGGGGHGRGHPAHPFADASPGIERDPARLAPSGGGTGDGHQGELVGRALAPRAAPPEVGHRHHGGVGPSFGQRLPAHPQIL